MEAIRPDIALVQEAAPELAARPGVITFAAQPHELWGTAVYVAPSLRAEPLLLAGADTWPACRVAAATVHLAGKALSVASVHPAWYEYGPIANADPEVARWHLEDATNVWHCDLAYGLTSSSLTPPLLVGGDWNTARKFQTTTYDDARVSTAFFERVSRGGWTDCTWNRWDEERSTHRGYQLDHLFADNDTARGVMDCAIVETDDARTLSDHLPLVVEFAKEQLHDPTVGE